MYREWPSGALPFKFSAILSRQSRRAGRAADRGDGREEYLFKNICLMKGHGITVTGKTIEAATVCLFP